MKWFKHDTDASNDPKIRKLKKKFGMVGYGVYFNLLELIARKMENDIENFGFLSDDWDDESLELEFGLDPNSVRTMFDYFCEIGLFEMKDGRLYNGKIQERCDDYTARIIRRDDYNEKRGSNKPFKKEVSEQSTNTVRTKSDKVRLEEIRRDKRREDKEDMSRTSRDVPSKPKKEEDQPMTLEVFVSWCKKSPQKHVQIIGDWAETMKPDIRTKFQWNAYIKRNLRPAKELSAFSQEQLEEGFKKIRRAERDEGWLKKVTLETLLKFVT